ncbi:MAG: DUF4038 domain-containing protein [Terriglobia bacterium]
MKTILVSYHTSRMQATLMALLLIGTVVPASRLTTAPPQASNAKAIFYPVRLSANGRYLVDRNNAPFLIVGDSPQGLISRLNETQADGYFADRRAHGFNTVGWIDVACAGNDFRSNTKGSTVDGILPFTGFVSGGTDYTYYDLTKPNEAYFVRLDHIVTLAAKHGILAFIDPIETIGWLATLRNNGLRGCQEITVSTSGQ